MQLLKRYSRYFAIAVSLAIVYLSFVLIKPYLVPVIAALILAYLFYPLYRMLNQRIRNRQLSSILVLVLIVIMIIIPSYFIANALIRESINFYSVLRSINLEGFLDKLSGYTGIEISVYFNNIVEQFISFFIRTASSFLLSLPQRIISLFVVVIVMYYAFTDGERLFESIKNNLPVRERYKVDFIKKLKNVVNATVYGVVVVGFIQGGIGALGFYLFKVPSPFLWGAVMSFFAMLPFVGAGWVWLPASIIKIASGDMFNGLGLMLYGFLLVSTIDNFLRPKLISRRAKLHPILILLGILGGIKLFGIMGLVLGPLLLAFFMLLFEYLTENAAEGKRR